MDRQPVNIELPRRAIICPIGLPGSGKSTWTDQQISRDTTGLLSAVNRDRIRRMIRRPYGQDEDAVTAVQHNAIIALLHLGHRVIIDDTNLNPEHLETLTQLANSISRAGNGPADAVDVVFVHGFLYVPLDECIRRDAKRPPSEQIGGDIITSLRNRWNLQWPHLYDTDIKPELPDLVIHHHD